MKIFFLLLFLSQFCLAQTDKIIFAPESNHFNVYDENGKFLKPLNFSNPDSGEYNQNIAVDTVQKKIYLYGPSYGEVYSLNDFSLLQKFEGQNNLKISPDGKLIGFPIRETKYWTYPFDITLSDSINIVFQGFLADKNKLMFLINTSNKTSSDFNRIAVYDIYKNKIVRSLDLARDYYYTNPENFLDASNNRFLVFDKDSLDMSIYDLSEMKIINRIDFKKLNIKYNFIDLIRILNGKIYFFTSEYIDSTYTNDLAIYSISFDNDLREISKLHSFDGIINWVEKGSNDNFYIGGDDLKKKPGEFTSNSDYYIYRVDTVGNAVQIINAKTNYGVDNDRFYVIKNFQPVPDTVIKTNFVNDKTDLQIQKKIEQKFVVFSDLGNYFITNDEQNGLILWDAKSLLQLRSIPEIKIDNYLNNIPVYISEKKNEIAVAYENKEDSKYHIKIFDLKNGLLKTDKVSDYYPITYINPNSAQMLHNKKLENYETGQIIRTFPDSLSNFTIGNTGKYIASLNYYKNNRIVLKVLTNDGREKASVDLPDTLTFNNGFAIHIRFSDEDNFINIYAQSFKSNDGGIYTYTANLIYDIKRNKLSEYKFPNPLVISDKYYCAYTIMPIGYNNNFNFYNIVKVDIKTKTNLITKIDPIAISNSENPFLMLNALKDKLYLFSDNNIIYYELNTGKKLKSVDKFLPSSFPGLSIRQSDGKFIFDNNGYFAFDPADPLNIEKGFYTTGYQLKSDKYIAYVKSDTGDDKNYSVVIRYINSFDSTQFFDAEYKNQFLRGLSYSESDGVLASVLGYTDKDINRLLVYKASNGKILFDKIINKTFDQSDKYVWFLNKEYLLIKENDTLLVFNSSNYKLIKTIPDVITFIPFNHSSEIIYLDKDGGKYGVKYNIYSYNFDSKEKRIISYLYSSSPGSIHFAISGDDKNFFSYSDNGLLKKIYLVEEKLPEIHKIMPEYTSKIGVDGENRFLYQCLSDRIIFYDVNNLEEMLTLFPTDDGNLVFVNSDGYYFNLKNRDNELFTFVKETKAYPFEQFDIRFNRPDKVLKTLGYASNKTIQIFKKAYQKRLKQLNIKEESLKDEFHMPEVALNRDNIKVQTSEKNLHISFHAEDSKYDLSRANIFVNGVPIYGYKGKDISSLKTKIYDFSGDVKLNNGENKIQVSVTNSAGAESLRETAEINYNGKPEVPDLYIIAVSVSDYLDKNRNLKYSVKDGRDLLSIYNNENNLYNNIYIDSLFNENATKENFLKLKDKLKQTKVDDQVIVFFSGHGLLNDNYDFYYATYDIDFKNPSVKGLSYQEIDDMFDGIPARKKLLLVDACHSGEVDKDEIEVSDTSITLANGSKGDLKTYTYKSIETIDDKNLRLNNSFDLMQELFSNLNKGNGTFVISAAAGSSFALESDEWKNGVFTYSIKDGLLHSKADLNNDNIISVNELKKFVGNEVQRLTKGFQKPTTRTENTDFDFTIYKKN